MVRRGRVSPLQREDGVQVSFQLEALHTGFVYHEDLEIPVRHSRQIIHQLHLS